ncbi:tail fiber domain-containing protein [Segetibacter koreensis]|uniref:tail fiber domain-containing protein n=1 Tax=Segetibacter koreensis TaxID=398037 RepID=UPI00037CC546|nr:tail fiber domain-containing protein [Segetibacter koreensis]
MKKNTLFSGSIILLMIAPLIGLTQANRQLSNLIAPTHINQHLWPATKCTYDLGTNSIKWRYGYFCRGIGISPNNVGPNYPLDIINRDYGRGISVYNNFSGNSHRIGVYTYSVNNPGYGYGILSYGGYIGTYSLNLGGSYTGRGYGVYATASGTAGTRYGVYGQATGSGGNRYGIYGYACAGPSNNAYGVYGQAACGSFRAAGYFAGNVWANNYFRFSDRKLKKGITPLKNSLQQLMKLKPSSYQFNTTGIEKMGLSSGNQMGLIADEVRQVFPELVQEAVKPAEYSENETLISSEEKFEGVNYEGLIPVLIASVQEQQKTIADLKSQNEELKVRLTKLEQSITLNDDKVPGKTVTSVSLNSVMLEQNNPNPFNENTVINYYLPQQSANAVLNITDLSGRIIKSIPITQKGKGQIILKAGQLQAGTYQYSLSMGGKLLVTKQMMLTHK